jgi:hypothetical protein
MAYKKKTTKNTQHEEQKAFMEERQEVAKTVIEDVGYDYFLDEPFCVDITINQKLEYLKNEVDRLIEQGKPILRAVLSKKDLILQMAALKYIREDLRVTHIGLRLIPDVDGKLPATDVNGRKTNGNSFAFYLGNEGKTGNERSQAANMFKKTGNPVHKIYKTVTIGMEPVVVSLSEAIHLLRSNGYGVADPQMTLRSETLQDHAYVDHWLLVEVPTLLVNQ